MRVISLVPGATDAIVTLGGAQFLVGVSHACDASAAELAGVARVTTTRVDANGRSDAIDAAVRALAAGAAPLFALDRDAVDRLRPDLIITQALCDVCAVGDSEVRTLAASIASRPSVLTLGGSTIDGILADISAIGAAIGLADEADELTLGLRARIRAVHDTLKAARAPRPRAAVLEWTDPLFAGGHWVPEQVRCAGGIDVLAEPGSHSRTVTPDALRAADPEVVFVAPCGFGVERAAAEAEQLIGAAPWLRGRSVWALDGNTLTSRPGPHVVDGIETMARTFAPSLFLPADAALARRVR